MGLEFVRGNNARCPPFLVGGLMVMCLFLLCSWWSLSSQNFELLRQIDNLAEQLKVNGEELNKCADQNRGLEDKVKDFQNRYNQERVKLDQVKEEEQDNNSKWQKQEEEYKNEISLKESELKRCHTEMDSLKSLGESKDKALETLRTDLEQKKSQIKELEENINKLSKNQAEKTISNGNVAQMLFDNLKNKNNGNKNVPVDKNAQDNLGEALPGGPVENENHEVEAEKDETNLLQSKNDVVEPPPVPVDPNLDKDMRFEESHVDKTT